MTGVCAGKVEGGELAASPPILHFPLVFCHCGLDPQSPRHSWQAKRQSRSRLKGGIFSFL